ncbi:M14 family zinc carboxypeptidase [Acidobacteriota bacterium]
MRKNISRIFFAIFTISLAVVFAAGSIRSVYDSPAMDQDDEYSKLIKEATTRPEFLSPLVSYLPKAEGIPTPKDVLGYIAGAPGKLTYYEDILRYMYALADASRNVEVFPIGKSGEGREMVTVVISDGLTIQDLKQNGALMAQLADPRVVKTEEEADSLIAKVKPVYWVTQNLHSGESGAAEASMELAYRLAVDDNPIVKKIRENLIILITPSAEPDGHDKHTDWFYKYNKDVTEQNKITRVPYWGKYDLHDNNRDMLTMSQPEMENITDTFFTWYPVVLQDNHESGFLFYVSSANGPSNFPPSMGSEATQIAWFEVTQMTAYGMPGVYTHAFGNTMWSPNFMASVASNHNAVFHFYETLGNAIGNTLEREVSGSRIKAEWYRPLPPPEKFMWSLRNNLNYQLTGDLLAQYNVANHTDFFLKNFWKRGKHALEQGKIEPPYAYVVPAGQKDPVDTAFLINVLRKQRIDIHRAKSEIKTEEGTFPKGSYVIRMDQPYRNLAVNLLGFQKYPQDPGITQVYDDAGWTLGLHMDVETVKIDDKAIFEVPLEPVTEKVEPRGQVVGKKAAGAYIFNNGTINSLLTARIRLKEFKALGAEAPFKVKDREFDAGSVIFPVADNPPELHQAVTDVTKELGLVAVSVSSVPKVKTHDLDVPRIAIYHTWTGTQDDGWVRFAFDQLDIPFDYIDKDTVKAGNLKDKYDVIVFSHCGGRSGADIVNGIDPERWGPLAFVKSEEFKHLGTPDSSEDITGGMGINGVVNLQEFAEEGGLLMALHNPVRVVLDYGLIRGISTFNPSGFRHAGSLLKGEVTNANHPAAYGFDTDTVLYRRHSGPLLAVPKEMEKYVVVKYSEEGDICLSGLVANQAPLKGRAAIVDVPVKKGHIMMFTFNPFWRDSNHGNYMFVFNSIMNFNDLDSGFVQQEEKKK